MLKHTLFSDILVISLTKFKYQQTNVLHAGYASLKKEIFIGMCFQYQ